MIMISNCRFISHSLKFTVITFLFIALSAASYTQTRSRYKMLMKHEDVSGFCDIPEAGAGMGLGATTRDFTGHFVGITNVFGYVIDHHYIVGLGIGANAYNGGVRLPAYVDIRYRFRPGKITPFLYTDAGGILNVNDIFNYGLMVNPGIGIISKLNKNLAFTFSVGIFAQSYLNNSTFVNVKFGLMYLSNPGSSCMTK